MPDYKQQQPQAGFSTENNPNQFNQSANQWAGSPQYQPNQLQEQDQQQQEPALEEGKGKGKRSKRKLFREFDLIFQVHNFKCFNDGALVNTPELLEPSDPSPLVDTIYNLIASEVWVKNFYYIVHDRDVNEFNEPEADHVHILVQLDPESEGLTIKDLSKISGLKEQQITVPKDQYFFNNKAAYLIHAADPFKFQYSPMDVVSFYDKEMGGESYQALYNRCSSKWSRAAFATLNKQTGGPSGDLGILVQQILSGAFGTADDFLFNEYWGRIYGSSVKNMATIDRAVQAYRYRYNKSLLKAFEQGLFNKTAFFVYGHAGAGKTTLCSLIVQHLRSAILQRGVYWKDTSLSGKNPLDTYSQEEIVIFEDIRPEKMSRDQWCLHLDPKKANMGEARYRDVLFCPRVTLLNQPSDILDFFMDFGFKYGEPIDQFLRRIPYQIEVRNFEEEGKELHQARLVPVVKLPRPQIIRESQSDDAKEMLVNYWPDTTQASEWMDFNSVAQKVVQYVIEQTPCLGLDCTKLSHVIMSNGESKAISGYGDLINASLMQNDRIPRVFEFSLGTHQRPLGALANQADFVRENDIEFAKPNVQILQAYIAQREAERNEANQALQQAREIMHSQPEAWSQGNQGNQWGQQFNQSTQQPQQAQNGFNVQPSGNAPSASNSYAQSGQGGNYYQQPNQRIQQAQSGYIAPQQGNQGNQWGQQFNQSTQQPQQVQNGFNMQSSRNAPSASNSYAQSGQGGNYYQQPNQRIQQAQSGYIAPQQGNQGNQWGQWQQTAQTAFNDYQGQSYQGNQAGNWPRAQQQQQNRSQNARLRQQNQRR